MEERTADFSERVIEMCKKVKPSSITSPIINQLVRAATSIGANYFEANGAGSKKDFKNKIVICKKEARETKYWLRLIVKADDKVRDECRVLWKEAQELTLIFSRIAISTK